MLDRGSDWRKWDLHLHTPESIEQGYGGEHGWGDYLDDLESLPREFAVLGVNDYLFIDGYRRLRAERANGRLSNISRLFPVIELRLRMFGGIDKLKRVNYHIVFSDELDPDIIESEFIHQLRIRSDAAQGKNGFDRTLNAQALGEFGNWYRDHVDATQKGGRHTGADHLNFDLSDIESLLNTPTFKGKHLRGIGWSEWSALRHGGAGAGEKRSLMNNADLAYTCSGSTIDFEKHREELKLHDYEVKLIDASDAHYFSREVGKANRIGECQTWIKADTTFDGLVMALREYDARVFVGAEPERVTSVREHPRNFVDSIAIERTQAGLVPWFEDVEIPLNPGLVAIIGNKGSGKSALSDVLGLVGNSHVVDFSFLSPKRFKHPKTGGATFFQAKINWRSGDATVKPLASSVDERDPELVRYLPQQHFENLCAEVGDAANLRFEAELKRVVYSWLDDEVRGTAASLDELVETQTQAWRERNRILLGELQEINRAVAAVEREIQPTAVVEIERKLAERQRELDSHLALKPAEVQAPLEGALEVGLADLDRRSADHRRDDDEIEAELGVLQADVVAADDLLERLGTLEIYVQQNLEGEQATTHLALLGIDLDEIVNLQVSTAPVEAARLTALSSRDALHVRRAAGRTIQEKIAADRAVLLAQLNAADRERQELREALVRWEERRLVLIGTATTPDTIDYLKAQLEAMPAKRDMLAELQVGRTEQSGLVHANLVRLVDLYASLFAPISSFLDSTLWLRENLKMNVAAGVRHSNLVSGFLDYIDQSKAGPFRQGGSEVLTSAVNDADFMSFESAAGFVDLMVRELRGADTSELVDVDRQLKQRFDREGLYDFLYGFSFLEPTYTLTLDGKQIAQLSPGERGAILLIFYLMVDQGQSPLIVDQPEENLDNETVATLLAPALREVREKRQVIIVTHNPNLAVYCDADQVIVASVTRNPEVSMSYEAGALEDAHIRSRVVAILEGRMPAFGNRRDKYEIGTLP